MTSRACFAAAVAAVLVGRAAPGLAAPTEVLLDCEAFKSGWTAGLGALDPGRQAPLYEAGRRQGPQRVANFADVETRVTCLEGKLTRVEIKQAAGDPAVTVAPFLSLSAATLIAFDRDLAPGQASGLVETMRAEARARRSALSNWGPYELTYSATGGRAEFVVDHNEN